MRNLPTRRVRPTRPARQDRAHPGSRMTGTPHVSWMARMADVAKVPEVLVDDHVLMQLADVLPGQLVHVGVQ